MPVAMPMLAPPASGRRLWPWVLGLAVLAIAVFAVAHVLLQPDPRDTVTQIRNAFEQRDVNSFEQYVNVHAVLDDGIDQMADSLASSTTSDSEAWAKAAAKVGARTMAEQLKPQMLPEMEDEVREFVSAGSWRAAGDPDQSGDSHLLMYFLHSALGSELVYEDCNVVSKWGDSAEVDVHVKSPLKNEPLTVKLKMQMDNGHWRVVAISQLPELLNQMVSTS